VHVPLLLLDDHVSALSVLKGIAGLIILGGVVRLVMGVTMRAALDSVLAVGILHQIFDASNNNGGLVDSLLDGVDAGNMTQLAAAILTVLIAAWLLWRRPGAFAKRRHVRLLLSDLRDRPCLIVRNSFDDISIASRCASLRRSVRHRVPLRDRTANLADSIDELCQIANVRNDLIAQTAELIAGSWYVSPATRPCRLQSSTWPGADLGPIEACGAILRSALIALLFRAVAPHPSFLVCARLERCSQLS
jgi:hypothetical protein